MIIFTYLTSSVLNSPIGSNCPLSQILDLGSSCHFSPKNGKLSVIFSDFIIIYYFFFLRNRNTHITGPIAHNLLCITQSLSI